MLGNPWNPMPGWLFPGLLDESMATQNTLWNRGAFDAVGVPYAFYYDGEILRRVLRTTGEPGFVVDYFLNVAEESFGEEGRAIAYRFLNDQFCWSRNTTYPQPPDPFWSASPQVFPMWQSETWTLFCNANRPPGAVPGSPSAEALAAWKPGDRPFQSLGDDLKRWSLFRTDDVQVDAFGVPRPYDLWQTYLDGDAESLPADQYRAGAFPFPELVLWGMTAGSGGGVYGSRAVLRPWNP
jgi:hypothetical protein